MTMTSSSELMSRRHVLLGGLVVAATAGTGSIAAADSVSEHRHPDPQTDEEARP
jgi:TAT (twin-arginine translocation) pathway signal sequence